MQKLKEQFTKITKTQNTARNLAVFFSDCVEKTPGKFQESMSGYLNLNPS